MNITPIKDEAEFYSVCSHIDRQVPRIIEFLKDELKQDVFTLDKEQFQIRKHQIAFLDNLQNRIMSGATRFKEGTK